MHKDAEILSTHIVIPDSQIHSGVPTDFLEWIGQYIVDAFAGKPNVKVVHLGDFADFPSLSSYEKPGSKFMEGARYAEDVKSANDAFDVLNQPLWAYNKGRKKKWLPDLHILHGNHEARVTRAIDSDPVKFEGVIGLDDLNFTSWGWTVHPFLEPLFLDGVGYSHYWVTPMTGRPMGGSAQLQLTKLGHTAISGHQQTLDYAVKYMRNNAGQMRSVHRVVAGAGYVHNESYLGPQGNDHWRGIVVLHEVVDGSFDPMFVSMNYLCRRYTGMSLAEYRRAVGISMK